MARMGPFALDIDIRIVQFRLDFVGKCGNIGRFAGRFDRTIARQPVLEAIKPGGAQSERLEKMVDGARSTVPVMNASAPSNCASSRTSSMRSSSLTTTASGCAACSRSVPSISRNKLHGPCGIDGFAAGLARSTSQRRHPFAIEQ